jgi:hypothetical protein
MINMAAKINVYIDKDTLKEFKIACIRNDVSMSTVLSKAVEKYISNSKPEVEIPLPPEDDELFNKESN